MPSDTSEPGRFRILATRKNPSAPPHQMITSIEGKYSSGRLWQLSIGEAILAMNLRIARFYVLKGDREVDVEIVQDQQRHKYLAAKEDGEKPESLLSLPDLTLGR